MKKFLLITAVLMFILCSIFALSGCGTTSDDYTDDGDSNITTDNGDDDKADSDEDTDSKVHIHSYDGWSIVKLPTCVNDGERERYCACGEKQTSVISSLGHNYTEHEGQAATCSCAGWEAYHTCTRCDYTNKQIIPALGHDIHSFEAQPATCTAAGYRAYEACTRCNYSTYIEQPALGHDFGGWALDVRATCSSEGSEVRVCRHDRNHTETRILEKLPHTEGEWIIVDATCENAGRKYKQCTECLFILQSQTIEPLGHDFGLWTVTKQPTCLEEGVEERICSHDKTHIEKRKVDKLPHTESNWITNNPTCERAGSRYKECKVCGITLLSESIAPLGHNFGEWTVQTSPTCTSEGVEVRICSRNKTHIQTRSIAKLAHSESEFITAEPTCTKDGIKYKQCIICQNRLEEQVLPATGHTAESQYAIDKKTHSLHCKICGEVIKSEPHDWNDNACVTCGYDEGQLKGLSWVLNDDKISYSISGIGSVELSEITIPNSHNGKPVTGINANAFADCLQLTSVIVPQSIINIGFGAFEGCNNLDKITLPFIGNQYGGNTEGYFGYIFGAVSEEENKDKVPTSLKKVVITGGTKIADKAFLGCAGLESVILPDSLEIIGESAFEGCSAIINMTIPASVIQIGKRAFKDCNALSQVVLENTDGWKRYNKELLEAPWYKDISGELLGINYAHLFLKNNYVDYLWFKGEII